MLIDTIQTNTQLKDIKTVKGAKVATYGNIIFCQHYDTVIFAYDENTKKAEIQKNLSKTSNRQIQFLVDFFQPIEITDLNANEKKFPKWSFSSKK